MVVPTASLGRKWSICSPRSSTWRRAAVNAASTPSCRRHPGRGREHPPRPAPCPPGGTDKAPVRPSPRAARRRRRRGGVPRGPLCRVHHWAIRPRRRRLAAALRRQQARRQNEMKERVRAVLVTAADTMLVVRRTKPDLPAYWVFPGGGVEPSDESREAALHREPRGDRGEGGHHPPPPHAGVRRRAAAVLPRPHRDLVLRGPHRARVQHRGPR